LVYKLLKIADVSSEPEEAMFTVHGVIVEKELPPIRLDRYDE